MKTNSVHLHNFIGLMHKLYPPDLAEEWDNVGLQVGEPCSTIDRIMVALDPSFANLQHAHAQECQLLLTHHPLIFKPLKQITTSDPTGNSIAYALRHNINIMCAHTNLDSCANGLNDWLAATLELQQPQILQPSQREQFFKLVVYVPTSHTAEVMEALFRGGAGHIGEYDKCAFSTEGRGQFRPQQGSNPFIGSTGEVEQVEETRIETIVPQRQVNKVLKQMRKAHPYEEVAYDLFELHNQSATAGLGRIGKLPASTTLENFAHTCKERLRCSGLRMVGAGDAKVHKVAVCSGSGSSAMYAAKFSGADTLVTGDLKYHEAQSAAEMGLNIIDAGHFATEIIVTTGLQRTLTAELDKHGYTTEIIMAPNERDPFTFI
ncbi:MAG: Nif3-like dinuclear metal center hexameric protein [Desulfuromonadaceae bacterium]|nr:Nif3-like dinuclear metal center hexameric protein [Desulfuromonadaceae bacterium]